MTNIINMVCIIILLIVDNIVCIIILDLIPFVKIHSSFMIYDFKQTKADCNGIERVTLQQKRIVTCVLWWSLLNRDCCEIAHFFRK